MVKTVKTAIVGCGTISEKYMENLKNKFSIIDLAGCCDVNVSLSEKMAGKYGIQQMSMEDILNDSSIEMVVNLTPPSVHYSVIKQLLEAGRHVYTEKVLSIEYEQAKELTELAEEKALYLGAAPDTFLGAAIQNAKDIADSGMVGEVKSCHAFVNRDYNTLSEFIPYLSKKGGSIGVDVGIYYLTALLFLLGPVSAVTGMKNKPMERMHRFPFMGNYGETYETEVESILTGMMEFENGALGTVHFNSDCIFPEMPGLTVYGTEGILNMADPNGFGGEVSVLRKGQDTPVIIPSNYGYAEESRGLGAAEMAWAIRNQRKHRANAGLALHAVEILHGFTQSSESGRYYRMQSTFEKIPGLKPGYLDRNYPGNNAEGSIV